MCEARLYVNSGGNGEPLPCEDNSVVRDLNVEKVEIEIYLTVHVSV